MAKYASKVIAQAKAWLGCNESDGSHKKIIDTYNAHKPLARGYKVKYTDAWCATFVSAVAIKLGYTDIIPTECGCGEMVKLLQKIGAWNESDSRKPNPGDILFFNWQASSTGDDTGWPDHVGIVENVVGNTITLIEGNYSNSVKRRTLQVDDKRIRGYGVPKYDKESTSNGSEKMVSLSVPQLAKGSKGDAVKALQILLIGYGYNCGPWGADGDFGVNTQKAVIDYQCDHSLAGDGIVGKNTWSKLLGV